MKLENLRKLFVVLAVTFSAGLLFVNVYNSVVDAPNWGRMIPGSLEAARAYFKQADPGTFFRFASPINQAIAILALILCWKADRRLRLWCVLGVALAIGVDMFTFAYFYPRNAIMFLDPMTASVDALRQAQAEWSAMNWIRSAVVALSVAVNFRVLFTLLDANRAVAGPRAGDDRRGYALSAQADLT